MNILIHANHYAVCSARYAADAFTRLGHSVFTIGKEMGRDIWGMQVPEEYVWSPRHTTMGDWAQDGWQIDLHIFMDSDPEVLAEGNLIFTDVPRIVWGVDNHVRDYRRPYFDHYFLAHKSVSVMAWGGALGHPNTHRLDMTWLPCAYDPVAFPPSPIAWNERQYDVCMIGVMYPQRWALVNAMRAAGLKVLAGTGLVYEAYRDAYHNSRVALVSSACGDLPIRLFEGAGMGCAVLADRIGDADAVGLIDGLNYYAYSDANEAVSTARWLMGDEVSRPMKYDGAVPGATRGLATPYVSKVWAQQHTFDARAQVIIDWLEARS